MRNLFLYTLFILICLTACKQDKKENTAKQIVSEWVGRTIQMPDNVFTSMLKDSTDSFSFFSTPYKILLYVDSTGCTACKLKLSAWKKLIQEIDTTMPEKLSILFYFQSKNDNDLLFTMKLEQWDYPYFIDNQDRINQLNHFPSQPEYQCFLLDKDNKVLMLGNPVLNPKIWELYKQAISGEKQEAKPEELTTAQPDKTVHDYGVIQKGSVHKAVFTITNTGSFPLIIHQVSASCGCTNVNWDKQPVEPGGTATVSAAMRPDEAGRFSKTIDVHCNVAESPLKLTLSFAAN